MSMASVASICMRKDISYCAMRVSGFGIAELRIGLLVDLVHRVEHFAAQRPHLHPEGFPDTAQARRVSGIARPGTRWARKPEPQSCLPPSGVLPPETSTMNPGRFWFSVPSP